MRCRRNILIFSVIALACGWVGVGVDYLLGIPSDSPDGLGMLMFIVTPMLAGVALRAFCGDGWRNTGFRPRFRGNMRWYLLAFTIFPVVTALNVLLGTFVGGISIEHFHLSSYGPAVIAAILPQLVKNFFEESAWRSYLTNRLLLCTQHDLFLYVYIGSVWALWHAPYYLFFLPDKVISDVGSLSRWGWVVVSVPTVVVWTVMFTEIYRATQSMWPLVVAHSAKDVFMIPLLTHSLIDVAPSWELLFSPIVGVVPNLMFLGIGLLLRHQRRRHAC